MTEIARWLTISAVGTLIGLTVYEVEALADYGVLATRSLDLAHRSISEESVTALVSASELAARTGEVLAEHAIPVRQGDADPAVDDEYELQRADYDDTPNDEGDEN